MKKIGSNFLYLFILLTFFPLHAWADTCIPDNAVDRVCASGGCFNADTPTEADPNGPYKCDNGLICCEGNRATPTPTTCIGDASYLRNCLYNGVTTCPSPFTQSTLSCDEDADGNAGICCERVIETAPPPPATSFTTSASFDYTPLEAIPGQESATDFPTYVKALYSFGIFSVGIAALVMVLFGGFIYVTAAGNTSQVDKGKTFIRDALIGIVVAFGSYLVLYIINPNLVNINLESLEKLALTSGGETYGPVPTGSAIKGPGNGSCNTISSGSCSVDSLKGTCLGSNAEAFSRLCNKESRGAVGVNSGSDICVNYGNRSFSGGLFQINVFANGKLLGDPRCNNLGSKGSCAVGSNPCTGWNCKINNIDDFDYCMALTHTAEGNIKMACQLSKGTNLNPWACSANKCGLGGTTGKLRNFCL